MTTVRVLLRSGADQLRSAGVPSPRVDAELLLAHLLGVPRSRLALLDRTADDALGARYRELLDRRATGVPLQHLTGSAPFRHLLLSVGPGVFVPRPETELIVEVAAAALTGQPLVVDLCAGSGAIALAVANETAARQVVAVERSEQALPWLRRNAAERAASGDRGIEVVAGDVADPELLSDLAGQVDVVLSNPPYVPSRFAGELPAEIAHDPAEAVFGGDDGLELMPALARTAARLLRPGGTLVVEHDDSHGELLVQLLDRTGEWRDLAEHPDLAGRPRFVSALRQDGRRE